MESNNDTMFINGKLWYKAQVIASKLGYKHTAKAVRDHVSKHNKKALNELCESLTGIDALEHSRILLNEDGVHELIMKARTLKASDVAKEYGITVVKKYIRKEIEIVSHLQKVLDRMKILYEPQKKVGKYKIDLYLPRQKLAIEIDEHGHKDRDEDYEERREETIQRVLKCEFLRVNPDDQEFDIFKFIGDVMNHIMIMT